MVGQEGNEQLQKLIGRVPVHILHRFCDQVCVPIIILPSDTRRYIVYTTHAFTRQYYSVEYIEKDPVKFLNFTWIDFDAFCYYLRDEGYEGLLYKGPMYLQNLILSKKTLISTSGPKFKAKRSAAESSSSGRAAPIRGLKAQARSVTDPYPVISAVQTQLPSPQPLQTPLDDPFSVAYEILDYTQPGPTNLEQQAYANMWELMQHPQLTYYSSGSSYTQDSDFTLFPQSNAVGFSNEPSSNINAVNFDRSSLGFVNRITQSQDLIKDELQILYWNPALRVDFKPAEENFKTRLRNAGTLEDEDFASKSSRSIRSRNNVLKSTKDEQEREIRHRNGTGYGEQLLKSANTCLQYSKM
ncbi:hypothetical protein GYMLUDRAFT_243733 [Collybiopsis luxurians FD-317 M1]|uniref:Uncharacterized protein n=1 Tax=Collybiopsis luxurians FD-317 M1 TaxID=944289 RepID=A0A0D0BYY9_9AGAR|nr:hypothetical protein GYMLUDRAFT_243733 [Collybiopsis luxurians FD-317 M1]